MPSAEEAVEMEVIEAEGPCWGRRFAEEAAADWDREDSRAEVRVENAAGCGI